MYKIRKINFQNHPILKNLELDFCGADGKPVDTVILAGENGTGKSSVLQYLYGLASGKVEAESTVILEGDGHLVQLQYRHSEKYGGFWVKDGQGLDTLPNHDIFKKKYPICGIFSDVDISIADCCDIVYCFF